MARNLTDPFDGFPLGKRHLIIDCDATYSAAFRQSLRPEDVEAVRLPPRSPNLPLYIVPQSLLADLGFADDLHGVTCLSLDLFVREYLEDYQGRGTAMVINADAIRDCKHPDDVEYIVFATVLHELAHILERPVSYAEWTPDEDPMRIKFDALTIARATHEPGNTSTFSAFLPAAEQGWEVRAVSIDALIDEACALSPRGRVRLLKIDAEGAEYPTLLTAEKLHLVDEVCGESHNNVPWQDELPGIAGLTHRLEEQGFVVTHIDNGPNTSIFWARRQPC